ncbi:hypothetical protein HDV05_003701 [Chytridiales sp. JEL 0842]|nr:hypothetical protein HDV05_003701 [Chytridiales sp. JEL 0842]
METQFEYGSRAGVWRILRLFQEKQWHFTCYAVGKAVEGNPEVIKYMFEQGHEIASHNYRWIDYKDMSEEEERRHVRKCVEAIKNATGKPPVGWYTGRIGPQSRERVVEEYKSLGLELLYDSDAYNDDLPYYVQGKYGPHLVIPYTLDVNDMKFSVAPGFTSPDAFFLYLKNTFDVLYKEGHTGTPKYMNVGLHCRLVGRPGRAAALKQFMDYVAQYPDVWVCTREQMARHWKKQFPPQ